jgi:sec-independent protein translocase protein TatC
MTVVEHLTELRRVLIVCLAAWLGATILAFFFNGFILGLLERPIKLVLHGYAHSIVSAPIITSPVEGFTIPVKIAAAAGFILALPVILQQVWSFIAPGLRPAERKFVWPFVVSALLLFAGGGFFAYFVMPIGLSFLGNFLGSNAVFLPDLDAYLNFFLLLVVIFGVTFELPLALVMLGLLGIISSSWLRRRRRGAYVVIIFAALVITPGADPFTPTALAIPLIVLFEAAILVLAKVFHR